MNLLSLYSGVGGIDLAAAWAGMNTVALCESDAWCRRVLARHWPDVPCFESDENVTRESIQQRIDIIAGGPPCQPFSVAGKRGGVADPRHRWPQMARIVSELRPAWVCVENVASAEWRAVADGLVRPDLESIGYETTQIEIPACAVGASIVSSRTFVLGASNSEGKLQLQGMQPDERRRPVHADAIGVLAAAGGERLQARDGSAGRPPAQVAEHPECAEYRDGNGGSASERAMARAVGRVAARMAGAVWPSPRGRARDEREPAPFADKPDDWGHTVKAIGNVCVPMQIYPILAAIMEWSHR